MSAALSIAPRTSLPAAPDAATVQAAKNGTPIQTMPSAPIHQSAGEIVGRPDLPEDAILAAVAERLAFEKRDPAQAKVVLDAALHGKRIAVNFVRSLALPMPRAPLEMPVQPLLADKPEGSEGRKRRFVFFG